MEGHFWTYVKVSKISYLKLSCLCLILTGSTFPRSVYTSVKKFQQSLTLALEISRYYRLNNKHGRRIELANVVYLTIFKVKVKGCLTRTDHKSSAKLSITLFIDRCFPNSLPVLSVVSNPEQFTST